MDTVTQRNSTRSSRSQPEAKPYTLGAILRYAPGSTALFRIAHIERCGGENSVRYFGQHCMGGLYTAPHESVILANSEDHEAWIRHASWRFSQDEEFVADALKV